MKKFRQILYCETEVELQKMCDQLLNSNLIKKYGNALIYFNDLFLSKKEWAVCYRNNSLLRESNTNNYVEAQFLVIKDSILRRERQFNVNMLLDKLFSVRNISRSSCFHLLMVHLMESTANVLWGSQKPKIQGLISFLFLKRDFSLLFIYFLIL